VVGLCPFIGHGRFVLAYVVNQPSARDPPNRGTAHFRSLTEIAPWRASANRCGNSVQHDEIAADLGTLLFDEKGN
jgi:hypothetical protein